LQEQESGHEQEDSSQQQHFEEQQSESKQHSKLHILACKTSNFLSNLSILQLRKDTYFDTSVRAFVKSDD